MTLGEYKRKKFSLAGEVSSSDSLSVVVLSKVTQEISKFHGLLIPFQWLYHLFQCGTGSIVGIEPVPGSEASLFQRGYMTCS